MGVSYVIVEQIRNDFEIKQTFKDGSCPHVQIMDDQFLERRSLSETITSMVTPVTDKSVSSYYVLIGEHGTG
jgi:hypothetical protein